MTVDENVQPRRVLTVRQVAREIGTTEKTIRQWLRDGRIRGVKPGGTRLGWRVPASEVDRVLGIP